MMSARSQARRQLAPPRWGTLIVVLTGTAIALAAAEVHSPARMAATFLFFGMCPGLAVVRRFRLADVATELVISCALSLAIATSVAELMAYSGIWSSDGALVALAAFTLIWVAVPARRLETVGGDA